MARVQVLHFLFFFVLSIQPIIDLEASPGIQLGVDYLESEKFSILAGKRVGLLTHPAGRTSDGRSTVMLLHNSSEVNLVALFGPEHGIYGDEKASVPVDDKIDHRTGLPVYSLYGKYRKPTVEMLEGLDCIVIDLQDVGVRCYTYVSCMRYVMEACFSSGVEVVVLDRPNPLGGLKVAGPMMDLEWISYVGAFPMPFVHGMTIAEIALWSKQTSGVLKIDEKLRKKGKLTIVPMRGWTRDMTWPSTGLSWYPTSPNIPHLDAVAGYPMTGLGAQLGNFKHGIGTKYPFRFLTFEGKKASDLKDALIRHRIPGLAFKVMSTESANGNEIEGLYLVIEDWTAWEPTKLAFVMMKLTAEWQSPSPFLKAEKPEVTLFNKHVGSTEWWNHLIDAGKSVDVDGFMKRFTADSIAFRKRVSSYLLY